MQKNVPRVAYNANNFPSLQATTQKSALILVHVCFSALLPTTPIIFPNVGHSKEKLLASLLTLLKNGEPCWQQGGKCSNSNISTTLKPFANLH
jgi:hypothetical protein